MSVEACSCAVHGHAPESPLSWSPGLVETWLVEPPLAFVVIDFRAEDLNGMTILQLDDRGKFMKELEIAHKARHPFVVSMLDACVDDNGMFLLMEWMDDGNLFDALGNQVKKSLLARKRLSIAREIAGGLVYLHSFGIISRDIKSLNVLLNKRQPRKALRFRPCNPAYADHNCEHPRARAGKAARCLGWHLNLCCQAASGASRRMSIVLESSCGSC